MGEEVRRMERWVSGLLRLGVAASGFLVVLGLALAAATGDTSCPYGVLTLEWVLWGEPFFSPSHILFLGFLTLVATPILRIAASVVLFLKTRDPVFAALTATVLIILLVSLATGVG